MSYYRTALPVISVILASCIYIPTLEHGLMSGRAMIRQVEIDALEAGRTTREDMLLMFGDPGERLDNDEYFCYRWERAQGTVLVYAGEGSNVGKVHYLCVQFSPDNVLIRKQHIEAFMMGNVETKRAAILDAWGQAGADSGNEVHQP